MTPARGIFIARAATAGAVVFMALGACGRLNPSPTPVRLEITGPVNHIVPGATGQVQAEATFSDQTTRDVTGSTAWSSSDTQILTVSSSGALHALAEGTVEIRARYAGLNATKSLDIRTGP